MKWQQQSTFPYNDLKQPDINQQCFNTQIPALIYFYNC